MRCENFLDFRAGPIGPRTASATKKLDLTARQASDINLMDKLRCGVKTAWRVLHMDLLVDALLPGYYAEIDKVSVAPFPLYIVAIMIGKFSYRTLTDQLYFFVDEEVGFVCPAFGSPMRCEVLISHTSTGITVLEILLLFHYAVTIHGTRFSRLFIAMFHLAEYLCVNLLILFYMYTHVLTVAWRMEVRAVGKYARRVSSMPFFIYLILYPIQAMHGSEFFRYLCEHLWEREMIQERKEARILQGSSENYRGDEMEKSSRIRIQ